MEFGHASAARQGACKMDFWIKIGTGWRSDDCEGDQNQHFGKYIRYFFTNLSIQWPAMSVIVTQLWAPKMDFIGKVLLNQDAFP